MFLGGSSRLGPRGAEGALVVAVAFLLLDDDEDFFLLGSFSFEEDLPSLLLDDFSDLGLSLDFEGLSVFAVVVDEERLLLDSCDVGDVGV